MVGAVMKNVRMIGTMTAAGAAKKESYGHHKIL